MPNQPTTADYLASMPALLQTVPEQGITVIGLRSERIALVVEATFDDESLHAAAQRTAEHHIDSAHIIVITRPGTDHSDAADCITNLLNSHDITTQGRIHTHRVQRGALWNDLDTDTVGTIGDPTAAADTIASLTDPHMLVIGHDSLTSASSIAPGNSGHPRARA